MIRPRFLEDDGAIVVFITSLLGKNGPALLAAALGGVAKARGMAREVLHKALRAREPVFVEDRERIHR